MIRAHNEYGINMEGKNCQLCKIEFDTNKGLLKHLTHVSSAFKNFLYVIFSCFSSFQTHKMKTDVQDQCPHCQELISKFCVMKLMIFNCNVFSYSSTVTKNGGMQKHCQIAHGVMPPGQFMCHRCSRAPFYSQSELVNIFSLLLYFLIYILFFKQCL